LIIGFTLLVELRHADATATPARMIAIGGCLAWPAPSSTRRCWW
jgi:hypothetical protein